VNNGPELAKSSSWNVRKPEGEEHRVTFGVWLPIEEIIYDIVDIGASTRARLRASASGELSTTGRRSAVRARRSVHQPVPPASSNTEPLAPKEVRASSTTATWCCHSTTVPGPAHDGPVAATIRHTRALTPDSTSAARIAVRRRSRPQLRVRRRVPRRLASCTSTRQRPETPRRNS
jgi:hypothetical protein